MEQVSQILNNVEHFVVKNRILIFVIVAVIVAAFYYNKYYSVDISFENVLREPLYNGKKRKKKQ
tara:strand:+ start:1380 stop:1571 length:192 start_codon:yes stop_codon:yes gene_type:complete